MKHLISIAAGLAIILLFTVSCGVSQEVYDKAAGDLVSLNATYEQVSGDLKVKEAELELLNLKFNDANESLDELKIKLDKLKLEIAIYNAIFLPALTGQLEYASGAEQQQIIDDIEANLAALGDAALTRKYNQMKFSGDSDATAEFFIYLLQDMQTTLE